MHTRWTDPLVIRYLKRVSSMRARDYRQITGDIVFSKTTLIKIWYLVVVYAISPVIISIPRFCAHTNVFRFFKSKIKI